MIIEGYDALVPLGDTCIVLCVLMKSSVDEQVEDSGESWGEDTSHTAGNAYYILCSLKEYCLVKNTKIHSHGKPSM